MDSPSVGHADEQSPDLLTPKPPGEKTDLQGSTPSVAPRRAPGELTEEEERELDELLNDDD